MIQDRAIVTMECQQKLVCNLSNGAIQAVEWPLKVISVLLLLCVCTIC